MKKTLLFCLIAITTLSACKEDSAKKPNTNNTDQVTNSDDSQTDEAVTYVKTENCDDFIAGIDFSSFCFTTKKTPKYRLIQDTEKSCQYQIYNDKGHQNIQFSIAFADYYNNPKMEPELVKQISLTAFKSKKNRRTSNIPEAKTITGLGDDAYIGFNRSVDNREQYLGVSVGNVSFTFVFQHGKELAYQSCMASDEDLKRIGQLVIDNLKKE